MEGGKLIGAILFSLGIFVILQYEMKLFTGLVSTIPTMKKQNLWKLPTCFLGNAIGVLIVFVLVYFTPLKSSVITMGASVISAKLHSDVWYVSSICSGILCGILITLSVLSVKHAHKKGLSANVGVMFTIIVFAFCGFDHSVANMFYFYCLGEFSLKVVGYILLTILGNVIGGVVLPLVINLKDSDEL
jgi:formate/nitrite transporter FocA (FNT family)